MNVITGRLGPREIALGTAFGVLMGLLPRDNLLFVGVAILFFFSHSNLVIGIVISVLTALAAPWTAPLAHLIGQKILNTSAGQQIVGTLFQIPLLPWTMLDNTIVLGSFVLGLALFLPLFVIVWLPLKVLLPQKEAKKK